MNYQAPALVAAVGRVMARAMALTGRRRDPLAREPRRSSWTPAAMGDLLAGNGFTVGSDADLLTFAAQLGLAVKNQRSVRIGRISVADR